MTPKSHRQGTVLTMALLAAGALAALRYQEQQTLWPTALDGLAATSLIAVLYVGSRLATRQCTRLPELAICSLAGLVILPLGIQAVLRAAFGQGDAPEIIALLAIENLCVGLAVLAEWNRCERISALMSCFVLLYATAMNRGGAACVLAVTYALVGMWWLMAVYWDRLEGRFPEHSERRRPRSWTILAIVVLLALGTMGLMATLPPGAAIALPGLLPASGGSRWYDPFARNGVGDGDALVAGSENAQSFGPLESGAFLESEFDSLYDVFNDTYGEPIRVKKKELAIALESQELPREERQMAQAKGAGREFSVVRKPPKPRSRPLDDTESSALLYLSGRTPLHLRQETFDAFDGVNWTHGPQPEGGYPLTIDATSGKPWLATSPTPETDVYEGSESHGLKVVDLPGNRIPAPVGLSRLHIDQVDRKDLFAWSDDGVLRMQREQVPPLIVIHLESPVTSPAELRQLSPGCNGAESPWRAGQDSQQYLALPETLDVGRIRGTAQHWGAGYARGWNQVEAVVARLRQECRLDRSAVAPADCRDAVSHLLYDAKRGPDYLFASTACALLRSLGYPARFVCGFYAAPERFDRVARHTPVLPEDVHCWVEVDVSDAVKGAKRRLWVSVEPTPGYEVLLPRQTWTEFIRDAFRSALVWATAHSWLVLGMMTLTGAVALHRRAAWDAVLTAAWRSRCWSSTRLRVLWTVWLLEKRLRLAGIGRPACEPLSRWCLVSLGRLPGGAGEPLRKFFRLAETVLYRPSGIDARQELPTSRETRELCRHIVRDYSVRRLMATSGAAGAGRRWLARLTRRLGRLCASAFRGNVS